MVRKLIIRSSFFVQPLISILLNSPLINAAYPTSNCCKWPGNSECTQENNAWCHANKDQCENFCSGEWLESNNPTNPPVSNPTPIAPSPVSNPTPTPPTGERGCCSINFKTCHHPEGTFCWESEENCVGPCGKYWLPNGPREDCTAQWDPCTADTDCCSHDDVGSVCIADGTCKAEGWAVRPSTPSTNSPVAAPIVEPTSPVVEPTSPVSFSPTDQPVTGDNDYCCTWDFYHCGLSSFCNANISNCQGECGGSWLLKDAPAMQCIAKHGECTKQEGSCCGSLECTGEYNYKQCI